MRVLGYLPNKEAPIESLMRVVRRGGKLIFALECVRARGPGDAQTIGELYEGKRWYLPRKDR